MSSYHALALWYDQLTGDVPYTQFADFYEAEFARCGGEFRLLLDLCCGTGTLTAEMTRRGYELIGADASVDMLMQAREKCAALPTPPLFLNQRAEELDLYGTVDAAFCSLDGMNYIPPESLPEVFRRLHLFIRPGGLVIYDVRFPNWFHSLDGQVFLDEGEDVFCVWRAEYREENASILYGMDLFQRRGRLWERSGEEHVEYAHEPEMLKTIMEEAGFTDVRLHTDGPQHDQGRLTISAIRGEKRHG